MIPKLDVFFTLEIWSKQVQMDKNEGKYFTYRKGKIMVAFQKKMHDTKSFYKPT